MSDPNLSSFIWSVADLLRGDYKQSDYGKVILPFTVLRRGYSSRNSMSSTGNTSIRARIIALRFGTGCSIVASMPPW
jgi:hypothetical protein